MAKDLYHQIVREALEKDGWTITQDPYLIESDKRKSYEVDSIGVFNIEDKSIVSWLEK